MMTFGGHLEVLRQMLFRILAVVGVAAVTIFCMKDIVWELLLAPREYSFCTYRWIEYIMQMCGVNFFFEKFHVDLVATDLSSQFMTHISTSCLLAMLLASPYIVYELFRYISPALYENERRYSVYICVTVYILFVFGVLMSYYVLFPISFRFLGTYSVSDKIHSYITLNSYIDTFITLTFVMGGVFQLPIVAFILGKMGMVTSDMLGAYRKHAFLTIMIVAAIITPPDLMTLILVTIPLYLLYEISIHIVRIVGGNS